LHGEPRDAGWFNTSSPPKPTPPPHPTPPGQHIGQLDHLVPAEYVTKMRDNLLDKCPISDAAEVHWGHWAPRWRLAGGGFSLNAAPHSNKQPVFSQNASDTRRL